MADCKVAKIDWSQIECRILNTCAGQWDVVEKFRNKVDIYSELATLFYGFPVDKTKPAERGTGKQLELSCGYGAGGPSIVRTARAGTYGPAVYLSDEQGLAARDLYRSTHLRISGKGGMWDTAGTMLWHLWQGHDVGWPGIDCVYVSDHRIWWEHGGEHLWLDFTSLERVQDDMGRWYWRHRVRNGWRKTYPGRLTENLIQWVASIPIRTAIKSIRRELGLRIPLTVHDDIFILIPNVGNAETLYQSCVEIARRPLPWLPLCPIEVEDKLLGALDE